MESRAYTEFERLSTILDTLRERCPWDRVQTLHSLRNLTVEEVYELSEAILANSPKDICKELGDIAMHVFFYAKIAADEGLFDMADVLAAVCNKLVARHPFIYGNEQAGSQTWEQLKMREGRRSVLEGVPTSLPTLLKAVRMHQKAAGIGFPQQEASPTLPPDPTEEQVGDYLMAFVRWADSRGINADDALSAANRRFATAVKDYEQQQPKADVKH